MRVCPSPRRMADHHSTQRLVPHPVRGALRRLGNANLRLCLGVLFALLFAAALTVSLLRGDSHERRPASTPFISHSLGKPDAKASLERTPAPGVHVAVESSGFSVTSG